MFDFNFRQRASDGAGDESRVRLSDLIAHADERSERPREDMPEPAREPAPETRAPEQGARGGGLVERWVPASVAGKAAAVWPGRRKLAVLGLVTVAVVGLLTGATVLTGGPVERRPAPPPGLRAAAATSVTETPASPTQETVVVSVVGTIATPGLVTLPGDARVADALRAAGGVPDTADRRTVNLARRLVDGEQLYIGVSPAARVSQPAGRKSDGSAGAEPSVELNTAGADALEELPGVGEVTAKRIIDWREKHGGFDNVAQLRQVDGIGAKRFADLRDLVRVR